ncbi:hypothetical protein B296_00019477 [Ensete ventricosum]|uniref:Uncharacterized protein n=1 Tax=Ensete ventricosum TaxID=4639 RepID=A0A427ABA4_ENSVE|nr:hypothetical protein B296_00019477 [Ensete ventricosum]
MRTTAASVSSSPGREKLPAPGLARILAGSGSRSRGRHAARSSPMFGSRSKSVGRSSVAAQAALGAAAATAGEEGEPSSPKVTCIGQVRIRNKKPAQPETPRAKDPKPPCQCFHKALLCSLFPARKKPKGSGGRSLWRSWVPLGGRSGGYQPREPDLPRAPPLEFIVIKTDEEAEAEEHEEATRVFVAAAPPKNALLLMRCRSAPHNSVSSLATTARCAVSSLPEHQLPRPPASARGDEAESVHTGLRKKKKNNKSNERWRDLAAAAAELSEVDEEEEEDEEQEEEATGSESQRPLVLTRSRSEPAWRRRRAA